MLRNKILIAEHQQAKENEEYNIISNRVRETFTPTSTHININNNSNSNTTNDLQWAITLQYLQTKYNPKLRRSTRISTITNNNDSNNNNNNNNNNNHSTSGNRDNDSTLLYHVGQVIVHKKHGYRGIIVGWDLFMKSEEAWVLKHEEDTELGADQPLYVYL